MTTMGFPMGSLGEVILFMVTINWIGRTATVSGSI